MKEFPYAEVSQEMEAIFGKPEDGTRLYRSVGNQQELERWFDALHEHIGPCLSPGGAAARAHVSRAAVHKRLRNGGLTAFMFHAPTNNAGLPWFLRILGNDTRGLCYIPVSECVAWANELAQRPDRIQAQMEAMGTKQDLEDDDFILLPKSRLKELLAAEKRAKR